MGLDHKIPVRSLRNKTHEHLCRDVPSVEYREETTSGGRKKIILLDRDRRHRSFAYVAPNTSILSAKNNLAIDYITKFNIQLDVKHQPGK